MKLWKGGKVQTLAKEKHSSIEQRKTRTASKHCEKEEGKKWQKKELLALVKSWEKKKENDFTSNKQTAVFVQWKTNMTDSHNGIT